jgi:FAD/FMN-containing dehydrogenase
MHGDALSARLAEVVGGAHVLADPELRASYETDWTGRFSGPSRLVVRPGGTEEVAEVVRCCRAGGAPVVLQGGNTGLVGGSVPAGGEVIVSLARLAGVEEVDEVAGQATVGAGTTLAALHDRLAATELAFGVDFAARDTATLGGVAATNAGGVHVIRYGMMRAQVLGLEAVLPDGSVISRMTGLVKDNAGFDLTGLLVGSEGTLGIITRLKLRLVPRLRARVVALFAVEGTAAALALFARLRGALASLEAFELFFADGLALVRAHRRLPAPFPAEHPAYVLVECADREDPLEALAAAVEDAPEVRDVAVADASERRAALWAYREAHPDAINAAGVPHKLDVALPLRALPEFEARVRAAVPEGQVILFGHVGDGNLHVNVLGVDAEDAAVDERVLRLAAELGGSVSAEHGIGRHKVRWLGLTRGSQEIAAMLAIKRALDPDGILNPGVLLPA